MFVAYRATREGRDLVLQLVTVAVVAIATAAIWYVVAVKFDWPLPSRRYGLGVPHPRRDAGVIFTMGWVWYVLFVVDRFRRGK